MSSLQPTITSYFFLVMTSSPTRCTCGKIETPHWPSGTVGTLGFSWKPLNKTKLQILRLATLPPHVRACQRWLLTSQLSRKGVHEARPSRPPAAQSTALGTLSLPNQQHHHLAVVKSLQRPNQLGQQAINSGRQWGGGEIK